MNFRHILPIALVLGIVTSICSSPVTTGVTDTLLVNITDMNDIDHSKVNTANFCAPSFTNGLTWSYDTVNSVWYSFTSKTKGTWWDMEKHCREAEPGRSSMATILAEEEQKIIARIVQTEGDVWIGAGRFANHLYWYTNIKNKITLQPLTYTHWYSGQPPSDYKHCVHIFETGVWFNQLGCDNHKFPAICEMRC